MSVTKTSEVFIPGRPTYLRFNKHDQEKMIIVDCNGVSASGACLNVVWSHTSAAETAPPAPGVTVQVHSLFGGVLFMVSGVVDDVSVGSKPRMRIRVDKTCNAVPLRKHPRYNLLGQVCLSLEDGAKAFRADGPHKMNLSMGGFGLTVPHQGYQAGDEIKFSLEIYNQDPAEESKGEVSYQIEGQAVVRRANLTSEDEEVHLGLEFSGLESIDKKKLEHWLAIQESAQRDARGRL